MRSARGSIRNIFEDQGGAVSILFSVAILVFIGFLALGLDSGLAFVKKNALQNAADAAALAAAKQMPDRDMALETALRIATYNGAIRPEDVLVDFPSDDTVTVSVRDRVRFLFAPVLGISEAEVSASAKGRYGYVSAISGRPYYEMPTRFQRSGDSQKDCERERDGAGDKESGEGDIDKEKDNHRDHDSSNDSDSNKDLDSEKEHDKRLDKKDESDHDREKGHQSNKRHEDDKDSSDSHNEKSESDGRDTDDEDKDEDHGGKDDKADLCSGDSESDLNLDEDSEERSSHEAEREEGRYTSGLAPLAVEKDSLIKNQLVTLKVEPGFQTRGNFHAVVLGRRGASNYERYLKYGYKGTISIGDILETDPGNMAGATRSAIDWRMSQDPAATFDNVRPGSPRILYVAVVDSFDEVQGRDSVRVIGFAAFFLEGYDHPGGVTGRFIDSVAYGDIGGLDFGLKTVRLVH